MTEENQRDARRQHDRVAAPRDGAPAPGEPLGVQLGLAHACENEHVGDEGRTVDDEQRRERPAETGPEDDVPHRLILPGAYFCAKVTA